MTRLLVNGRDPCAFSRSTNFASLRRVLNSGPYTAIVRGADDTTGIALVEAYDRNAGNGAQLANISTRGVVERDENVLIGGFIVGGGESGAGRARVVVRAIGPSLSNAGIQGVLQNPTLQLVNADGVVVRGNNNWKEGQRQELETIGFQPLDERESALIETLSAGNYTAIVRGVNDTTGVGLVEVYNIQ